MLQVLGRRVNSLRIGRYTNISDAIQYTSRAPLAPPLSACRTTRKPPTLTLKASTRSASVNSIPVNFSVYSDDPHISTSRLQATQITSSLNAQ